MVGKFSINCEETSGNNNSDNMPFIEFHCLVIPDTTISPRNITVIVGEKHYDYYELYNYLGILLAIIPKDEFSVYEPSYEVLDGAFPVYFSGWKWVQPSHYVPKREHFQGPFYMRGVKQGKCVTGLMEGQTLPSGVPPNWGDDPGLVGFIT